MAKKTKFQRWFWNPCIGTSFSEGVQMVAIIQVIMTFAYVIHGGILCLSEGRYFRIYGLLYIVSGISYFSLAYLLYTTVDQPSISCFRWWCISSSLTQVTVFIAAISRNVVESETPIAANIWIGCAFFIQCYMIWLVVAYMEYDEFADEDEDSDEDHCQPPPLTPEMKPKPNPTPVLPPPASTTPTAAPGKEEDDNDNDDKDTVIIESSDETEAKDKTSPILSQTSEEEISSTLNEIKLKIDADETAPAPITTSPTTASAIYLEVTANDAPEHQGASAV